MVEYYVGGGIDSNVSSNTLTNITKIEYGDQVEYLEPSERTILNTIKGSVKVNNNNPAMGGKGPESSEEIRRNALAYFSAQNRAVTREDYVTSLLNQQNLKYSKSLYRRWNFRYQNAI